MWATLLAQCCTFSSIVSYCVVCSGILVPGGFGQRGTEGKILAINYARQRKIPYLGEGEGGRVGGDGGRRCTTGRELAMMLHCFDFCVMNNKIELFKSEQVFILCRTLPPVAE